MRVVFMGTPRFSVPSLDALVEAEGIEVVGVFTQPDAVSGRGRQPQPTPVRQRAEQLGIPVRTPRDFSDPAAVALLAELRPDAIVVVSYGNILPQQVLDIPPLGCINAHASLLPRWRGAAPIERAILADDKRTGVSIMRMQRTLDTGPWCLQRPVDIDGADAAALGQRLAHLSGQMLVEALEAIEAGRASWTEQDDAAATYAAKVVKSEMLLSPTLTAAQNVLRVRASGHHAPAKAVVCGRALTVLEARELVIDGDELSRVGIDVLDLARLQPGQVFHGGKRLLLAAADGVFEISSVKPDGKRQMDAEGFAAGVHAKLAHGARDGGALWEEVVR